MARWQMEALYYLLLGQESINSARYALRLGSSQVNVGGTQDNQTIGLTHAQNPLPWCDEISTAKESPQGWTHRPGGWPRGFRSDSVCDSGSSCDRTKSTHCWACLGDDRKCA